MKVLRKPLCILLAALSACIPAFATLAEDTSGDDGMNMYENSDFIEKEQPELDEQTKRLIALYQQNPSDEAYLNLRRKVIEDYNAVVARKEAKLAELKAETVGKPGRGDRGGDGGAGPGDLYHLLGQDQQQHASLYRPAPAGMEGCGRAPV